MAALRHSAGRHPQSDERTRTMPQDVFFDITMSLDGYIAGVNDSP